MKSKIDWKKLTLEMAAIVFSVLFALLLDDMRENRNERELTNSVLVSLRVELERNQDLLESRLPHHEGVRDSLSARLRAASGGDVRALGAVSRLPTLEEMGFPLGLAPDAAFSRSGWEVGLASEGITRISTDQLFLFATAYATQLDLRRLSDRLLSAHDLYRMALVEGDRTGYALLNLTTALSALVEAEAGLCDTYRILARQLYGDGASEEGRCGSGNIRVS